MRLLAYPDALCVAVILALQSEQSRRFVLGFPEPSSNFPHLKHKAIFALAFRSRQAGQSLGAGFSRAVESGKNWLPHLVQVCSIANWAFLGRSCVIADGYGGMPWNMRSGGSGVSRLSRIRAAVVGQHSARPKWQR